jgi:preprotein translocase subunit SecE
LKASEQREDIMAKKTRAERRRQAGKPNDLNPLSTPVDAAAEDNSVTKNETLVEETEQDFGDGANATELAEEKAQETGISEARAERLRKHLEKQNQKKAHRERKAPGKAVSKESKLPKPLKTFINYCSNVKAEVKRVVWPSKQETLRMSLVVLFALIFFGIFIFLIDSGAVPLLDMYSTLGG